MGSTAPAHVTAGRILAYLKSLADPANVEGMARFGISAEGTFGVRVSDLRAIAKGVVRDPDQTSGRRHELAEHLWASGVHEARILAALIDVPSLVDESQMERWVRDFDSWDTCDQVCGNLFDKTVRARDKAIEWSSREGEFVKRAGFVLMAQLAVHDKAAPHGKRSAETWKPALALASTLAESSDRVERWVGREAKRELESAAVRDRLGVQAAR